MIYLPIQDVTIKNPVDVKCLPAVTRNYIYDNLDKGLMLFLIPDDLENTYHIDEKKFKNNYKVGFLYDLILLIYPQKTKSEAHEIIDKKFHCWITYRQFYTIINDYSKDRKKYILQRNFLFK
jgi:hypothetical protein